MVGLCDLLVVHGQHNCHMCQVVGHVSAWEHALGMELTRSASGLEVFALRDSLGAEATGRPSALVLAVGGIAIVLPMLEEWTLRRSCRHDC